MNLTQLLTRFRQTVTAYAGDEALMQAGVSAAANVIVADGEVAGAEFETALTGVLASPILEKGYDVLMLEEALYEAIGRARTRAGRTDNLRRVAAIAGRAGEQREGVFLVAADVADHDGIAEVEHAALAEIAAALLVNKAALLQTVPARTAIRRVTA
ncbi:tellurite resistance TerB family protein [Methylobacterium sp. NMS14P]|uniref:tellurite resistance TerB family protein n=1 Tax=unclassified Methylobacterium TaxID=2615210 RepID=UPI002358E30B|nr:tellurite resistance TerB family protein [Methylobacterium sp. NMS14P]WCS24191.1 tellurite resistance TerB family protein [Methylobacterium sp. NMS14P]